MIDIDRFKGINDTYGHPVGDKVIRRVADIISGRLRSTDIAVRYGGEEVLAVLLDADLDTAQSVAEDLRTIIADTDLSELGLPPGDGLDWRRPGADHADRGDRPRRRCALSGKGVGPQPRRRR